MEQELPQAILELMLQIHGLAPEQGPLLSQLRGELLRHLAEQRQQVVWAQALQGGLQIQLQQAPPRRPKALDVEGELIKQLAYQDSVTGLPNQALGRRFLSQQLARSPKSNLALVVLDVLGLRQLNRHLGRELVDRFLRQLAQRLQSFISREEALVRGQEDEFWLIWPLTSGSANKLVGQVRTRLVDLLEDLEVPLDLGDQSLLAMVQCGVALSQGQDPVEVLIDRAQLAVEASKGQDRISFWNPSLEQARLQRRQLAPSLQQAVEEQQFRLRFLPVVHLSDLSTSGVELLLRWEHPQQGLLQPSSFLESACQSGLMVPIGDWVMTQACRLSRRFPQHYISWNLSAQELLQGDFVKRLCQRISQSGARPDRLVLEISESHLTLDQCRFLKIIQELQRWHLHIAIDDFSFDSLALKRLETLQIRFLKLGPQVARHIDHPLNQGLVRGAVLAADSLGARLIAEGVEHESASRGLLALGCNWGQGQHLSPLLLETDLASSLA